MSSTIVEIWDCGFSLVTLCHKNSGKRGVADSDAEGGWLTPDAGGGLVHVVGTRSRIATLTLQDPPSSLDAHLPTLVLDNIWAS